MVLGCQPQFLDVATWHRVYGVESWSRVSEGVRDKMLLTLRQALSTAQENPF